MIITKNENTITITSTIVEGYSYVHVVEKINIDEANEILSSSGITNSVSEHILVDDGSYIIFEFLLPNVSDGGYYISNNVVYTPTNTPISYASLILVDTEGTNIVKTVETIVNLYKLEDLYSSYLQNNFLNCLCSCKPVTQQSKLTVDVLTMGLNLISILQTQEQFYEIQRIINKLQFCHNSPKCNCNG